jgi:uncharacterized membrane protein YhhN
MKPKLLPERLFYLVSLVHLAFHLMEWREAAMITKPLLMPLLWGTLWVNRQGLSKQLFRWLLGALICSWLGDVLLMWDNGALSFLLGMAAFFAAQLAYVVVFLSSATHAASQSQPTQKHWWSFPLLLIAVGIYLYLYPHLDEMRWPVLVYILAISSMILSALHRLSHKKSVGGWLVFVGALCFMLSDSLLAINKFVSPIPQAGFLVMLSYLLAQWLLLKGMLGDHLFGTPKTDSKRG